MRVHHFTMKRNINDKSTLTIYSIWWSFIYWKPLTKSREREQQQQQRPPESWQKHTKKRKNENENEKATRRHNNYTNNNNNDLKGFMHFISTQAVKHIKLACSWFSVQVYFVCVFFFSILFWDHQVNSDRQVSTSHSSK